jgi:hypothetical protein
MWPQGWFKQHYFIIFMVFLFSCSQICVIMLFTYGSNFPDSNPFHGATAEDSTLLSTGARVLSPTNPFYSALTSHTTTAVTTQAMDTDPPPPYTETYQANFNTNPFVTAPTKLAPPDKDLISLRDSDEESASARKANSRRLGNGAALSFAEDKPSTLMDTEMSQPLIGEIYSQKTTRDSNDSNLNNAESQPDLFDFITDVVKAKSSSSSAVAKSQKKEFHVPIEENSRTTRLRTATKAPSTTSSANRVLEAIELSSDEDHTQDMNNMSNSPVY